MLNVFLQVQKPGNIIKFLIVRCVSGKMYTDIFVMDILLLVLLTNMDDFVQLFYSLHLMSLHYKGQPFKWDAVKYNHPCNLW